VRRERSARAGRREAGGEAGGEAVFELKRLLLFSISRREAAGEAEG
jgi:hypothetical protein